MLSERADPLQELFGELVTRTFGDTLRLRDGELLSYLVSLLARFAHRDRLFAIRDARGRPLEAVAEMLMEGDLLLNARSFEREREVHRHVGDFTLFIAGVWPEWHERIRTGGGPDALLDYRATGRHCYYVASTFQHEPYRRQARVLRRLSEEFTLCEYGLGLVRHEIDALGAGPEFPV